MDAFQDLKVHTGMLICMIHAVKHTEKMQREGGHDGTQPFSAAVRYVHVALS